MSHRTAIVTGGARGIGAAIGTRLAADGYAVGVIDLRESDTAETVETILAAGGQAVGVGADVSDGEAVTNAVTTIAEALGAPTVLVNNAGILRDNLLFKMTDDDWDAVMRVHLAAH
jgi:3-oxoacyl-[acyl-carrier protein] reductase